MLQAFAQGLVKSNRQTDVVARMGGDEFVVAIAGLTEDAIKDKMATMVRIATQAGEQVCGESVVSLSVGHSTYHTGSLQAKLPDPNILLAEAGQRMYEMKAHRRHAAHVEVAKQEFLQELIH